MIEAELRLTEFIEILSRADRRCFEELLVAGIDRSALLDEQIDASDRKMIRSKVKRAIKRYSLSQTAHLLRVHRQTLYYWMKKRWLKPKRDYRDYPVFTVLDIERIVKWRNLIRLSDQQSVVSTVFIQFQTDE